MRNWAGSNSGAPNNCRLCIALKNRTSAEDWNDPLYESSGFVVIPSLGSLVKGWLLIVPKRHVISAAMLDEEAVAELGFITQRVAEILASHYGSAIVFEHGPSCVSREAGCGVDHAHVHMLPFEVD